MKSKVAALSLILLAACGGGGTSTEPTKAPEADIVIPETPTTAEPSAAVESEQPKGEQHPQKEDSLDYLRLILAYAERGARVGASVWETAEEFERGNANVKIDNERTIANIARAFADLGVSDNFDILAELAVMEKWKNRTSL